MHNFLSFEKHKIGLFSLRCSITSIEPLELCNNSSKSALRLPNNIIRFAEFKGSSSLYFYEIYCTDCIMAGVSSLFPMQLCIGRLIIFDSSLLFTIHTTDTTQCPKMNKSIFTLGQNPTFYPWKCEFCQNESLKIWILSKMWFLWKMRFWKCEFCEKWDFENVIFVKNDFNETLKLWIEWKMRFSNCDFCEKWDFQNVIS